MVKIVGPTIVLDESRSGVQIKTSVSLSLRDKEIIDSLIEVGEILNCYNQGIKRDIEMISSFKGLKFVRYFIKEGRYDSHIEGLNDFKRIWKLELINKLRKDELLVEQELFDSSNQQGSLFQVID